MWAHKGAEADGVVWMCCFACLGPCMIERQRDNIEVKLHRWHKERGDAVGEAKPGTHQGAGGLCSLRWWPCTRPWLVAENVAVLANFKRVQGLGGWPANQTWAAADGRGRVVPAPDDMERELSPAVDAHSIDGEAMPLVRPSPSRTGVAPSSRPPAPYADELEALAPESAPMAA